jgi:hypothetical protein
LKAIAMNNHVDIENIENILAPWKELIGSDYQGYRNHVIRMASFCLLLEPCSKEEQRKIEIAACFHDIGIWTDQTLDYLPPSIPPAREYLETNGLGDWVPEISQMILEHHKIRRVKNGASRLTELFRKGDLVDFSRGAFKFGLSKPAFSQVVREFPNAGFHSMLLKRSVKWFLKHPIKPLPMMKW